MENGTVKLDLKDRRILQELDTDARQSCSKIAKKVGVSPEVVYYRIKRLEEAGIITQYQLIVNLAKLNVFQFKICLTFQHITSSKLGQLIDRLKQNNAVKWIASCKGNWQLIISLEAASIGHMASLKDEVLSLFGGHIEQRAISVLVEAETYNRTYLSGEKGVRNRSRFIMKWDTPEKLGFLDLNILKKLGENARRPVRDIATELKSTPRRVAYRIQQLNRRKIILGSKIAINYQKTGIKFYKTFFTLDNPAEQRVKSLIQRLSLHKNVIHHIRVLGDWDLEPEFEVYSESEFNNIITNIKDEYADIIKKIDVINVLQEHKFVYF